MSGQLIVVRSEEGKRRLERALRRLLQLLIEREREQQAAGGEVVSR